MPTVGEILRSEREKKGLSIKDIEKATSIRALYLNAIEEDNYTVVPGEVYLKGFIRNYANFLGLDTQSVMDLYRQAKAPTAPEPVKQTLPKDGNEIKTGENRTTDKNSSSGKSNKLIIAGVAGILVLGALWWAMGNHNQPQQQPDQRPAPVSPAVPAQPSNPIPERPIAQSKPVTVIAKYTDSCWTLVTADGKEVYEGIPKVGETITWEAQNNLTVQLGNASGVEMTYNGQSLGKMGGKGEVLKKTFNANTTKQ